WLALGDLRTLLAPAVLAGVLVSGVFIARHLLFGTETSDETSRVIGSLALLPPALLGTISLLVIAGPVSQYAASYTALVLYAYALISFLANEPQLARQHILLHNARTTRLSASRRC